MARSKVDRIGDVFRRALYDAISYQQAVEGCNGNFATVKELGRVENALVCRAIDTILADKYRRLELSDIIRGHKRAWPEESN